MAAFPHGERLELLGSRLLNNNTERQFARLTCCSRQRVPFPSRQQAAFTVCPWMLQTPTSPPSTVLNAKEETHKEECGRIGSQTLELCTMKNSFHHVAGFSKCHQWHRHYTAHHQSKNQWFNTCSHPQQHTSFQMIGNTIWSQGNRCNVKRIIFCLGWENATEKYDKLSLIIRKY